MRPLLCAAAAELRVRPLRILRNELDASIPEVLHVVGSATPDSFLPHMGHARIFLIDFAVPEPLVTSCRAFSAPLPVERQDDIAALLAREGARPYSR